MCPWESSSMALSGLEDAVWCQGPRLSSWPTSPCLSSLSTPSLTASGAFWICCCVSSCLSLNLHFPLLSNPLLFYKLLSLKTFPNSHSQFLTPPFYVYSMYFLLFYISCKTSAHFSIAPSFVWSERLCLVQYWSYSVLFSTDPLPTGVQNSTRHFGNPTKWHPVLIQSWLKKYTKRYKTCL